MKITEIALEDIKSYEGRTTVPFDGGVTAILGENGAGKSTIQEAIGFALFDSLPMTNREFVREGASSGTVEVTFEQTTDDGVERFRVTRSAGRSSHGVHRWDASTEEWVDLDLGTVTELREWLCARFGVEDGDALQSLWESCIGVPQTRFLSDFAQTPANRTRTFDALLDLEAYEESWERLKQVPDAIEAREREVRDEIQTLTGEVQSLPDEREQAAALREEISEIEATIEERESRLAETREAHDELDQCQDAIEDLDRDLDRLDQQIDATESELATAREELDAAREAAETCDATRDDHQRYVAAVERREELTERQSERDALREQHNDVEQTISGLDADVERLEEVADRLDAARATIQETAEDRARYEALDERLDALDDREAEAERLRERIADLDDEIERLEANIADTRETVETIESERESTPDPDSIVSEIRERETQRKTLAAERDRIEAQLDRLSDTAVDAPCPTCDRPLDAEHREAAIDQRQERLEEIDTERATLAAEIDDLRERHEAAQEVQRRVDTLDLHREKLESLETEHESLCEERSEAREDLEAIEDDLEDRSALAAERDALEDAHEAYETAVFRLEEHGDVPDRLDEAREQLAEAEERREAIEAQLADYETLDDDLDAVAETIAATEDAHETFVANRQLAETVADRRETVEQLDATLDDLHDERSDLAADLDDAREAFDAERFEELQATIEDLDAEIERARGTVATKRERLADVREEIDRLESLVEDRAASIDDLRELRADAQFAAWIRENVREAGPKLREIITERIGARANELFRTIRGVASETLEWTSDYEIVVHDADVRKSFSTLSGGEKMAAALAVRLAILEQIAAVGVAFLDEPTANLDRQKKRNLVTQLKRLDSFEQLAVISHDRTFDSMTDATVSVEKSGQASEVVLD
ncbi:AAA family ATPase [Halococcoides cellulosivorans]|uniref:SMC family ATPase n=1 Tax=Halococcoides cellulosivorans TaxID=1679096 RepID=A0A2R4X1B8_9EURY|nr:SMC family ATPase [Halococcoides cellulosivorans]AWB27580.1 SMC family ATPase [Halococcoides cellulosivorans]